MPRGSAERGLLALKRLARRAGVELLRFNEINVFDAQRLTVLQAEQVDLVLDVGANTGQYARGLRRDGWTGPIVSFEPLTQAYAALEAAAADDPNWSCRRVALGEAAGEAELHVAGNSWSSSLLQMEELHARSAPRSAYVGLERVPITRLDALESLPDGERIALKLDIQGGELAALRGAEGLLPRIAVIEVELSLRPLYRGAPLYRELLDELNGRGFSLAGVDGTFAEPETGRLLQMDALLVREG